MRLPKGGDGVIPHRYAKDGSVALISRQPGQVTGSPAKHVAGRSSGYRVCEQCDDTYVARSATQRCCSPRCYHLLARVRGSLVQPSDGRGRRLDDLGVLIASGHGDGMTAEGKAVLAHLRQRWRYVQITKETL